MHAIERASEREHSLDLDPSWRPIECRREAAVYMSEGMEPRFLELMGLDATALDKARAMFEIVKATFQKRLEAASFIDVYTRARAVRKLAMIAGAIGQSANLDDFADLDLTAGAPLEKRLRLLERAFDRQMAAIGRPLDTSDVVALPSSVSAWADSYNGITVPGGMLGGFFFAPQASHVANSAGIGFTFGHEIGHQFGPMGTYQDGNGEPEDWWTEVARTEYEKRTQCLVDQYNAFTLPGVADPSTGEIPAHVDGMRTTEENFADNVGAAAAFSASGADSKSEPIVAGFTPAQQFFVGHAQAYCSRLTPQQASAALACWGRTRRRRPV